MVETRFRISYLVYLEIREWMHNVSTVYFEILVNHSIQIDIKS